MTLLSPENFSHLTSGTLLAGSAKAAVGSSSKYHEKNEALQEEPWQNMKFWQHQDRDLICIDFLFSCVRQQRFGILSALIIKVFFFGPGHQLTQNPITGQSAKNK